MAYRTLGQYGRCAFLALKARRSITAWGIAPGKFIGSNTSAESALHFGLSARPKLNSRFQRWVSALHETWGVAPGSRLNAAPLALNTNETSSARHAHLVSKEKITFQSFFMLMTVQPFFFASS
jgi:hypothetical protein